MPARPSLLSLFLFCFFSLADAGPALAEQADLTIFHTTDTHGHIATNDQTIGLDLVSGIVRQTPNAILVDAGDYLMGAPLASLSRGKDVVALMKKAGYFASAVGNHEFDYGQGVLMMRKAEAEASPDPMLMLSANVRGQDGNPLFSPEARTSLGGVSLCFFGLTTQETLVSAASRHIAGIAIDDAVETARAVAHRQRASGCELVVLLSHVGSQPAEYGSSRDLATIPGIDLIIDGHSHLPLDATSGRDTPLVSSGAYGQALGRVDIRYDKADRKIIKIRHRAVSRREAGLYAPDEGIRRALAELTARQNALLDRGVGEAYADMEGAGNEIRTGETPLGNFLADALRKAYPCDLALINSGAIRGSLKKGPVSMRDIVSIVPFREQAVIVAVSGRELLRILEFGFSRLPEASGGFPQVSGITVRLSLSRPSGNRVEGVYFSNGAPLDPDRTYLLATNEYLAGGGDGYPLLRDKKPLRANKSVQEAVEEFLSGYTAGDYLPGAPKRIVLE